MRFIKAVDIWTTTQALQPGQWVYAGTPDNRGVYMGRKPSGSVVVAWYGNAKSRDSYRDYLRSLRDYAKAV